MNRSIAGRLTIATALAAFLVAGGQAMAQNRIRESDGFWSISAESVTLKWKVDGNELDVIVRAETTGWVSVGFDPTSKMKDANIIIGYVKDGSVFLRDDFGVAPVAHRADTSAGGKDDVSDKSGSEANGITELRFTIPLDSGDVRDRKLVEGRQYSVILAYGPPNADDYGRKHPTRTTVKIKL
jgi:hypothetical protein